MTQHQSEIDAQIASMGLKPDRNSEAPLEAVSRTGSTREKPLTAELNRKIHKILRFDKLESVIGRGIITSYYTFSCGDRFPLDKGAFCHRTRNLIRLGDEL